MLRNEASQSENGNMIEQTLFKFCKVEQMKITVKHSSVEFRVWPIFYYLKSTTRLPSRPLVFQVAFYVPLSLTRARLRIQIYLHNSSVWRAVSGERLAKFSYGERLEILATVSETKRQRSKKIK